jgi:hypothetical protein
MGAAAIVRWLDLAMRLLRIVLRDTGRIDEHGRFASVLQQPLEKNIERLTPKAPDSDEAENGACNANGQEPTHN